MGLDDDADCVEHVFAVDEVHLVADGADVARSCGRCGATSYDADRPGQDAARPRLD